MVDPRFVQESGVLSTLDTRPNLMERTPSEFESLITNLFEQMGLETRQTQASRDGGVDWSPMTRVPFSEGGIVSVRGGQTTRVAERDEPPVPLG
jgi:restriction system protein